jgi:flagellar basal body-associated protein FliL
MPPLLPMTGAAVEAPADAAPAKKSKKKLIIVVVVLLVALVGAKETLLKPKVKLGKDGKPIVAKVVLVGGTDVVFDPVTTSIADGHVIQIALGLQLVKGADATAITAEAPQADDAAVQVLAGYTYKVLLSPVGRAKAKREVKKAVIKALLDNKKQTVYDVFLPTYVLQ